MEGPVCEVSIQHAACMSISYIHNIYNMYILYIILCNYIYYTLHTQYIHNIMCIHIRYEGVIVDIFPFIVFLLCFIMLICPGSSSCGISMHYNLFSMFHVDMFITSVLLSTERLSAKSVLVWIHRAMWVKSKCVTKALPMTQNGTLCSEGQGI